MPTRSKPKRNPLKQSEDEAQKIVCQWLDLKGLLYCHPFNGGKRSRVEAARYTALGVKPGVPDLLIFHTPPYMTWIPNGRICRGVALELKASEGGRVSPAQHVWHRELTEIGWLVACHHGSNSAIDWLENLYGKIGEEQ